jgi:hypothetical protein
MNVDGVKKTAQALCLDPNGDHSPPEIIDPLFVQAFQALLMELDDTDFAFNEETVEIPGIAAGTRDLRDQGAAGKPLERMVDVRDVDWKLAGEPETSYRTVRPLDRKLDVDSVDYLRSWEVTAGVLFLSPVNVAIDLRVRCEMEPIMPGSDDMKVAGKISAILAYELASLLLAPRNPRLSEKYEGKSDVLRANLEASYTKSNQGKVRRWGRTFGQSRSRARGFPTFR